MQTTTKAMLLALALALAAGVGGARPAHAEGDGPPQVRLGDPAPGFRLPDLDGNAVDLEDFRGRFVVLHFGTSW